MKTALHCTYDAGLEKMTMFALIFAIVFDAILGDLRVIEDKEFESDMAMREFSCIIRECYCLQGEYKYIAD